ncbi:FAD-dependent oxidoreductase [Candidatus Aerophobetes bacterium]|nr:FAD-dependent oxidoreductase [Candidatus Aerophobetes bacterium]
MAKYKNLFKPIKIGSVEIKNRIAFAPLATEGLVASDGALTQRGVEYYAERARGGAGLIITGVAKVENEVEHEIVGHGGRMLITPHIVPRLGELAEIVHYYGAKLFVQLTAGDGRNSPEQSIVSASEVPSFWIDGVKARALTEEEIKKIVEAFGAAAGLLKAAGVDGVELNGHEGYLLDEFQTALWNRRTDRYGGDLRGRLTFAREILESIRAAAGNDFPVMYKYGLKHYMKALRKSGLKEERFQEAGRDIEEGIELTKLLEEIGFDALDVDAGCYDSNYWVHPPMYQPHGCLVEFAEQAKKVVTVPVVAVGRLDIPDLAEEILKEGKADMIALGRALLADPYWPKKVKEEKEEDIRPCIGCHEGCLMRIILGKPISCAVNPQAGGELYYRLEPASRPKKILVVGGGVAGMEAARVACIRGHQVILYEKGNELGGHLREASVPDFKKDIARLLEWYKTQISKLNIPVKMNTEVTASLVKNERPDVVIIATGSVPLIPEIPGIDNSKVVCATDILLNDGEIGEEIVVMGGGMIGLETALWLAKKGKKVTVAEMLPEVGMDGVWSNKEMLLDLLAFHNVEIKVNAEICRVTDDYVEVTDKKDSTKSELPYDNLILACGLSAVDDLYRDLESRFPEMEIYAVGDCKSPRKIMQAIWDAYHITRSIR